MYRCSAFFAIAAVLTLFGVMHSPMASGEMFWPWNLTGEPLKYVAQYAAGYGLVAILLAAWGAHLRFHGYELKPLEDHH
jgi:hypothetical protein